MEAAIFIFYLLLFSYLVAALPFFKNSGLKPWQLIALFWVKITAGFAYAFFYKLPKYYQGSDTWRFYRLSLKEKQWLLEDPIAFIKDLFIYGYDKPGNLFAGENSYWNDLKSNVPVKLMACTNVITDNSYYTNIILFNFLFLIGMVALYKVFEETFPGKKLLVIAGIFLLPSTLFWCSGIHKDGLILSALGIITYYCYKGSKGRFGLLSVSIILFCIILIFSLRNYFAIALLPALLCWYLTTKSSKHKIAIYASVYLVGAITFFSSKYVSPKLDFPKYIAEKQSEFAKLEGTSTVQLDTLQPSLEGFIGFLPNALDMAFLRPHLTEARNFSYIPAALENILFILILVWALVKGRKVFANSTVLFCFFLSLTLLLLAGYTITLSGAIVRYRSISLPLLITPLICSISFKKSDDNILKDTLILEMP